MEIGFLVLLLPVVFYIIAKQDFAKIFFYKARILTITFIILLISPIVFSGGLYFIPIAEADNNIRQVIKISDIYPAGAASAEYIISPPLLNKDKAFVYFTVSNTGENDHSDTFRSIEIVDNDTLRLRGENTAAGNNAVEFIAYIVEYDSDSNIDVQHLKGTVPVSGSNTQTYSMSSVNTTNSMIIFGGHHHNASETTIGNEEFDRIRILNPTTWEYFVNTAPNSGPQGERVQVVDWNQDNISVQRGLFTMADPSFTGTVSPSTPVDPSRTILMITYTSNGASSEDNDDLMLRASLADSGKIRFSRADDDSQLQVAWELIEFPEGFVRVQHFNTTLSGGTLATDVFTGEIRDYSNAVAISHVGTPFGYSGGTGDEAAELPGAIDRSMVKFLIHNNTKVELSRDDSTGLTQVGWQLIEFLDNEFPEKTHGTNFLEQVVKIQGVFNSGNVFQDFTISPALTNINKTMIFVTMNSTFQDGSSENGKMWEILNPTTFRITGSGDAVNDEAQFNAVFIEMNGTSPIFVQRDLLQYPEALDENKKFMAISPVNLTSSFIVGSGAVMEDGDPTFGMEEFPRVRLENGTKWSYETQVSQDITETAYRAQITDFNDDQVLVQRGIGSLTGLTETISPPTAIDRERTLLFITYRTNGGAFGEFPSRSSVVATLNSNNDITLQRNATGNTLDYSWQTISFLADQVRVQHGIHHQNAGEANMTQFIPPFGSSVINASKAFAIGTVGEYYTQSMGSCSSTVENDFDCAFGYMQLENSSSLRLIRGDATGSWDMGFQVTEFLFGTGGNTLLGEVTSTVNITDSVNATLNAGSAALNSTLFSNATITDIIQTSANFTRIITSQVNITDFVFASINRTVITSNTVNITDSSAAGGGVTAVLNAIRSITNTVNITDSVFTALSTALSVNLTSKVTIDDPSIVIIKTTPPTVTPPSTGSSGGGGPPTVTPPIDTSRSIITGLALSKGKHLLSTEFIVNPFILKAEESGVLELNWDQQTALRITNIKVPIEFQEFVKFKETPLEYRGEPQFADEDFSTGGIEYQVSIPPLTLGITKESNPLGSEVRFFEWLWIFVFFNEYVIPVTVEIIHNNNEFTIDSTITITQVRQVQWVLIVILTAVTIWLAWYGKRYFREDELKNKSGSFKKKLDSGRKATIDRKPKGSFRKNLQKQRDLDRENIKKLKRKR